MTVTLTAQEAQEARQLLARLTVLLGEREAPEAAPAAPSGYAWVRDLGDGLPLTIEKAMALVGTKEIGGAADNPVIMAWAKEVGVERAYTHDAVPWCGLFAAVVCKRAGKEPVKDPLWALNWAKFGVAAGQPGLGDVLVFTREGGGHVGFYVAEDATAYHVLGGNTSDQVMIARIEKRRLHAARRPKYRVQPSGVKPYLVAASGALSTNEA